MIKGYRSDITTDPQGDIIVGTNIEDQLHLMKYNPNGQEEWSVKIPELPRVDSIVVTTDSQGNIYLAANHSTRGSYDVAVVKYDSKGKPVWVKPGILGTDHGFDFAWSITSDQADNLLVSGYTDSTLPGQEGHGGSYDAYVAKYNPAGELLWLRQFGSLGSDFANAVATDAWNNVYVTGHIQRRFGKNPTLDDQIFLTKYNSYGSQLWTRELGKLSRDSARAIAVDHLGYVFICGIVEASITHAVHQGRGDIFCGKFDPQGNQVWLRQLGSPEQDTAEHIAVDQLGSIYIGGFTHGGLAGQQAAGSKDVFLAKYVEADALAQHHLMRTVHTEISTMTSKLREAQDKQRALVHGLNMGLKSLATELAVLKAAQLSLDLDAALLQLAQESTTGRGNGRISEAEAQTLVAQARDADGGLTDTRRKTLAFIFASHNLTRAAQQVVVSALS